jgi:hypothetical protein
VRREGAHQSRDGNPRRARVAGSIVSIESQAARAKPRPNVVVIETDDQTLEEMRVMRNTLALIGRQGTTFRQQLRHPLALLPVALVLPSPGNTRTTTASSPTPRRTAAFPGSTTRTRSPSGCRTRATTPRSSAST